MGNQDNHTNSDNIKNILKNKRKQVLESHLKVNKLECEVKEMEKQKTSIKKIWNLPLTLILLYIIYNLTIILLLTTYTIPFIDVFVITVESKKIFSVIALSLAVIAISLLGSYITSKVKIALMKCYKNRDLNSNSKIEAKKQEIAREIEIQKSLEKEITLILAGMDIHEDKQIITEVSMQSIKPNEQHLRSDEITKKKYTKKKEISKLY